MKGLAFKTADLSDLSHLLWGPRVLLKVAWVHQSTLKQGLATPCPAFKCTAGRKRTTKGWPHGQTSLEPDPGPSAKSLLQILPKRWEPAKKALLRTKAFNAPRSAAPGHPRSPCAAWERKERW